MNTSPKVSFVVPCYNYGRYLEDCLSSIFNQDLKEDFEVIVIDDASTDNTQDVIKKFKSANLIPIIHDKNMGHVISINKGLYAAKGDFIARIDADDRYRSNFLSETLPIFYKNPEVGLVYGDPAIINEKGEITLKKCNTHSNDFKKNVFIDLLKKNFICAPTTIARKEAWQEALPIPEGFNFSDWYLSLKMARKFEFYYVDKIIADYRVHSNNWHSKITKDKSEEETILKILNSFKDDFKEYRNEIYAAQYLDLANKYFGNYMDHDAKRCYLKAIRYKPGILLNQSVARRLLGTLITRNNYEKLKSVLKKSVLGTFQTKGSLFFICLLNGLIMHHTS